MVRVAFAPVWEKPPLKLAVIFSSPGQVKVSDHELIVVVPVLAMVTWDVKPLGLAFHALFSVYVTWHAPPPLAGLTVQVKAAVPFAPVVSVTVTVTLNGLPVVVVGVPEISPVEELIARPAGRPAAL